MEIERKFLVKELPEDLESYPFQIIEQGYLNINPVVRVRRQDETYYLTYKSEGFLEREEYNLPLTKDAYEHLIQKADGKIVRKKRYLIPFQDNLTIELDQFDAPFSPLFLAEIEFSSVEEANNFVPPNWFAKDVTGQEQYYNSNMSI